MPKTLPRTALLILAAPLLLPCPTAAQGGDLLVVEKREDLPARNRLLTRLAKIRVTVNFNESKPKEVVEYLQAVTGTNFIVVAKGAKADDLPATTLKLKSIPVTGLMSIYEEQTGLRFTFNSDMVMLRPKDEVKEFAYMRLYDVRAAVMPVRNFKPKHRLGLRVGDTDMVDEEEEPKPLMFDMDRLIDLIKSNAVTESWDRAGISMEALNGVLMVRQTVEGHRKVQEILIKLGAIPAPRVIVRRRAPLPEPRKKVVSR